MTFLLAYSKLLIHELDSDYRIKRFLDFIPIIGLLIEYIKLWQDLSLTLTIVQTLLILIGNYKYQDANGVVTNVSRIGNMSEDDTYNIRMQLGILQIFFASIIFVEFILRKCPTYYRIIDEKLVIINSN